MLSNLSSYFMRLFCLSLDNFIQKADIFARFFNYIFEWHIINLAQLSNDMWNLSFYVKRVKKSIDREFLRVWPLAKTGKFKSANSGCAFKTTHCFCRKKSVYFIQWIYVGQNGDTNCHIFDPSIAMFISSKLHSFNVLFWTFQSKLPSYELS